jgi:hypothetical protein
MHHLYRPPTKKAPLRNNSKKQQSLTQTFTIYILTQLRNNPYFHIFFIHTDATCDVDIDGCANDPCPLHTTCNDKSPADQVRDQVLYNCSNCPAVYQLVDGKCIG